MAARASDISARSSTSSSARVISAISRSSCCSRFSFTGCSAASCPSDWSLALIFVFIAIPVGTVFGTSFVHYAQLAARGFADPAAYILFVAGMLPIIGRPGEHRNFFSAFFGALLLALAIWMKPIVAPAAAVLLGGAGVAALYLWQWPRLIGLSIGIMPVFLMTLHNWVFGHVFVLFSANAQHSDVLVMPPSAYAAAAREILSLDVHGAFLGRLVRQIANWLSGPAESFATIPLNAAGVAVLIYVVFRGRQFDPWLRLVGASALAQHAVALFYTAAIARYHFLSWFLTMLVVDGLAATAGRRIGCNGAIRRCRSSSSQIPCADGLHPGSRGCKKCRHEQKTHRHRQRPHQLWRPRLLAVFAPVLRAVDGLFAPHAGEAGRRHRLYAVRLQQLPSALPGPARGGKARRAGVRRAADRVSDDLARRGLPQSDQPEIPQPDVDGHRGDGARAAHGCGRADGRLRQDGAGPAHGRGVGGKAGNHAGRRPDDDGPPSRRAAGRLHRLPPLLGAIPRRQD